MSTQLASYNFVTVENPLSDGGKFSKPSNFSAAQVAVSNLCQGSANNTACVATYTGLVWANDQYSEITVNNHSSAGDTLQVLVRCDATGNNNYFLNMLGPLGSPVAPTLGKTVAGSFTTLATGSATTFNVNDVIRLSISGTSITVTKNGTLIPSLSVSDSSVTSGNPGFGFFSGSVANNRISLWAGGNPDPTFSISGNAGVAGATLALTGASTGSTTAAGDGSYSFSSLFPNSYTITPSLLNYTFSPTSLNETIVSSNITNANFVATAVNFSVTGNVGVAGATVSYSGPSSGSTTADSNGNFTLSISNGTYTITPTKAGYVFHPTSFVIVVNGQNISGVNFNLPYSVPDCRTVKPSSATSRNVNGTATYDVQTSSNNAIPPTDSRKAGAPVACGTYPQNSRTPGTFGPGE